MVMNRNFTAICAAMLMCAILIVFIGSVSLNKNELSFADAAQQKEIYLTFDDGPSDRVTPKILDILKEENVKATFFIVGKSAEKRKTLLKREFDEGHSIGVHSYTHRYKEIYASPQSLIKDIDRCNELIKEVCGKKAALYRFPGGSYGLSSRLVSAVSAHGMKYVDWNASFRDSEILSPSPEQLVTAAKSTVANPKKIVMLAHDSTDKSATAEALKSVIMHFKNEGYIFKAL